ncbi:MULTISPECIES: hypothetical protein [unclassified Microcoleus]|nr:MULTISPECIES: hypothetical protein [unclassified Microcoleus]
MANVAILADLSEARMLATEKPDRPPLLPPKKQVHSRLAIGRSGDRLN